MVAELSAEINRYALTSGDVKVIDETEAVRGAVASYASRYVILGINDK